MNLTPFLPNHKFHKIHTNPPTQCVPYDPLTLQYNDSHDGEKLRYADDMVRYRARVRAQNMKAQGDTRTGYNIINGIAHNDAPLAPPPSKSEYLKHYEQEGKDDRK